MIDWGNGRLEHDIRVAQVDPHNLNAERGELEDLILSGCSISYGYETDTRTTAKLKTLGSNYIGGSWLRIYHTVGDWTEELGTYVLQDEPSRELTAEGWVYTYELQSVLWTLSADYCPWHFSIGAGGYAVDAFDTICNTTHRDFLHISPRNYRYSSSKVYEAGCSFLDILFDIADTSGNRVGVDGHGRITLSPYQLPAQITPAWTIDEADPRTVLLATGVSYSSSSHEVPSRTLVVYTSGDTEIIATADRPASSEYSSAYRGYTIADKYSVSDMVPATNERARQLAQQYLDAGRDAKELSASFLYFPCQPGEVLNLILDGEQKRYQIKSIDPLNLNDMTISTTLREI